MSHIDSLKNSDIALELNSCSDEDLSEGEITRQKITSCKKKRLSRKRESVKMCLKLSAETGFFDVIDPKNKKSKKIQQNEGETEEQISKKVELMKITVDSDNWISYIESKRNNNAVTSWSKTASPVKLLDFPSIEDTFGTRKTKGITLSKQSRPSYKTKNSGQTTNSQKPKFNCKEMNSSSNTVKDEASVINEVCSRIFCGGSKYNVVTAKLPVGESRGGSFEDQFHSSTNSFRVEKKERTSEDKGNKNISGIADNEMKNIILHRIFSANSEKPIRGKNNNESMLNTTPRMKEQKGNMWKKVSVSNRIREYTNQYLPSSTRKPNQTYSGTSESSEDESTMKSQRLTSEKSKEGHQGKQSYLEENSVISKERRRMDRRKERNEDNKASRKHSVNSIIKRSPLKYSKFGDKHFIKPARNKPSRFLTSSSSSDSENDSAQSPLMNTNNSNCSQQQDKLEVSSNQSQTYVPTFLFSSGNGNHHTQTPRIKNCSSGNSREEIEHEYKMKVNSYEELSNLPDDKSDERSFTSNVSDSIHKLLLSTSSRKESESSSKEISGLPNIKSDERSFTSNMSDSKQKSHLSTSSSKESESNNIEISGLTNDKSIERSFTSDISDSKQKSHLSTNSSKKSESSNKEISGLPNVKSDERSFTSNISDSMHKLLLSTSSNKECEFSVKEHSDLPYERSFTSNISDPKQKSHLSTSSSKESESSNEKISGLPNVKSDERSFTSNISDSLLSTSSSEECESSVEELSNLPNDKSEEMSLSDSIRNLLWSNSLGREYGSIEMKSLTLKTFQLSFDRDDKLASSSCSRRICCSNIVVESKDTYSYCSSPGVENDFTQSAGIYQAINSSADDKNGFRKANFSEKLSTDIVNCSINLNTDESKNPLMSLIHSSKNTNTNHNIPKKWQNFHKFSLNEYDESSDNTKFMQSSPDSSDVEINSDQGPKLVAPFLVVKRVDEKISTNNCFPGRSTRKRKADKEESEARPSKISIKNEHSDTETKTSFLSKKLIGNKDNKLLEDLYDPCSTSSPWAISAKKNLFSPNKKIEASVISNDCSTPTKQKKDYQKDKENFVLSSRRHNNESTPQKSFKNLRFDEESETDSPVKYKVTPLKPAQTPTKQGKVDSSSNCERGSNSKFERGSRTPTKLGDESLGENQIENELSLSEDRNHGLSPRTNISESASKLTERAERELKRLNIDCVPSLFEAPSPVRKSRSSVLKASSPQKRSNSSEHKAKTPQLNNTKKDINKEDEQGEGDCFTPRKNESKLLSAVKGTPLEVKSPKQSTTKKDISKEGEQDEADCFPLRKNENKLLSAGKSLGKNQIENELSPSEDRTHGLSPRTNISESASKLTERAERELKRLNIDCVPSLFEAPSPVRERRSSVLKAITPQKRSNSSEHKAKMPQLNNTKKYISKEDEQGVADCFTPHKNENKLLSAAKGTPLSPAVKLKQTAMSPRQQATVTVTTPVSKKKSGRGFLTPSMARKEHVNKEKAGDDLDTTRKQLHISTIPESLPCRDKEFDQIRSFLLRKIENSGGGCMYISGVPGTGKTATVHAVVRSLQRDADNGDLPAFDFVEVNGLRLTEPRQAYVRILQALGGRKLSPDQAQQLLSRRFGGDNRRATVILVDELDYLCNRRQDVVYNILDWPSRRGSALTVLTISNTMDLPERTLKGRVTSRMGLTRVTFQPYSHHQLRTIVEDRLSGSDTFHPDAVQLVARKVAAVSGDARRALDICRRTTELVKRGEQVTVSHVERALTHIFSGPRVAVIQSLSREAQLVLRAIRDVNQRTGVDEAVANQVYQHLLEICLVEGCPRPTVGALLQSCTALAAQGLIMAEKGRVDIRRKMSLNVSSDDIHYALDNVQV